MTPRAPFFYPGGKSACADEIWAGLGADAPVYIEGFCGSCAVLLKRPGDRFKYEVINDASGLVMNVWRALKLSPDAAAAWCKDPSNETDLRARAVWLRERSAELTQQLERDPLFHDPQAAGWWIWCQAVGLGPTWLENSRPAMVKPYRRGILSVNAPPVEEWFAALKVRLRNVSMACGDWERMVTPSALGLNNTGTLPAAVFLDPAYVDEHLDYGSDAGVARRVEAWCAANGSNPHLRIVLAGHVGDYELPGWRTSNWGGSRGWGRAKRGRNECLWFSPHCLPVVNRQSSLFSDEHATA